MAQRFTTSRVPAAPARRPTVRGAQAVLRAVAILRAFSDAHPEWGGAALARAVGLNRTTAFRLLSALEQVGLVARGDGAGSYHLGPEAIALGAQALRSNDLRAAARPQLEALAVATGETATLEILVGADVLIIDEVQDGRHRLGTRGELGTRWPAHATSTGKVLLAAARREGVREGVREGAGGARAWSRQPRIADGQQGGHPHQGGTRLVKLTSRTIDSPTRLDRELEATWKRGYATAIEESEVGFVAVGAPVRNHDGRVVAAISLGGPAVRITRRAIPEMAAAVRRAADRVSGHLGARRMP